MPSVREGELWTPSRAARILGVSASWVGKLYDRGLLEGVRDSDGRRLLWAESVKRLADERQRIDRKEQ